MLSLHRHAAERRQFLQLIQRERRTGERLRRQRHQQQRVIIRRDAVGVNRAAHPTAVEQRPFAVFTHPYADGFHQRAAVGFAVAGGVVKVNGAQAVRAMVTNLNKTLDMLNFKCWYYSEAIKDGNEERLKNIIPNELPNSIKSAYMNSHKE